MFKSTFSTDVLKPIVLHASKSTCLEDHHRVHRAEDFPCQSCKVHLRMIKSSLHVYRAQNDVKEIKAKTVVN